MLDLKGYTGFALMKGDNSLEAQRLSLYCLLNKVLLIRLDKKSRVPELYVPCGSVEWCLQSLDMEVTPDYYPDWLSNRLYRKVWKEDKWPLKKVFIKPSDKYKRFSGFCTTGTYKKKKKPPFWCSDIIEFTNEWRYYISNRKVLCSGWYWGDEVNTPDPPELTIWTPKGFCGAIDFGTLKTGEFALVEVNHPFACGWYGKDDENYFQWLIDGWLYMSILKKIKEQKKRLDKRFKGRENDPPSADADFCYPPGIDD